MACQGYPGRWDEYQEWPSMISPEFLDLLGAGSDIALLVFAHWAAVMTRSTKPFVKAWAFRAGMGAVNRLQGHWAEQLVWPLSILSHGVRDEESRRRPQSMVPFGVSSQAGPGLDFAEASSNMFVHAPVFSIAPSECTMLAAYPG